MSGREGLSNQLIAMEQRGRAKRSKSSHAHPTWYQLLVCLLPANRVVVAHRLPDRLLVLTPAGGKVGEGPWTVKFDVGEVQPNMKKRCARGRAHEEGTTIPPDPHHTYECLLTTPSPSINLLPFPDCPCRLCSPTVHKPDGRHYFRPADDAHGRHTLKHAPP